MLIEYLYYDDKNGKEIEDMGGTLLKTIGDELIEQGIEQGIERGIEQGIEQGIEAIVLDNIEEGKTKEQIVNKLIKRFNISEKKAEEYYDMFSTAVIM